MAAVLQYSYDYIVCGGGSAGCVVASRLSEDPSISVLLLEAGISDLEWPDSAIPNLCGSLQRTKVDWDYKCEPQSGAYKAYRDVTWSKGKLLGGCSSHNYMTFIRCAKQDYDLWAKNGCDGWSWKEVLPYFLKSENHSCSDFEGCEYHNKGGPITVSKPPLMPVSQAWIEAGIELGYKEIDPMSGDLMGFGITALTVDENGIRASTSRAFIHPNKDRPNLTVLCEAHVSKIEIKDKKACGVHFLLKAETQYAPANKEVIVSGGPIASPQILLLSGIGPRKHLEEVGIECIADLPVGQNLQDQMFVQVKTEVKQGSGAWTCETVSAKSNLLQRIEFTFYCFLPIPVDLRLQPGLKVASRLAMKLVLILKQAIPAFYLFGPDEPDIQVLTSKKFYPYVAYDVPREERLTKEGIVFMSQMVHPKSVGEIRLKTTNPLDPPVIDPRYLQDHRDIEALIQSMRMSKKIMETSAMKKFEYKLLPLLMPGIQSDEWSDDNLEEYIRHFAFHMYHPVGTCKMGRVDDTTAVVDPSLRVRGIASLRVIDSSIMPMAPSGNTNAPTVMIGEKGADMIKADA